MDPGRVSNERLLTSYLEILNPEERRKKERFRFEKDRHLYLVARALVRKTLSRYAGAGPEEWEFVENSYGKPALSPGSCELPLQFNLSHTDGLIALGLGLNREVGVDVERIARSTRLLPLAEDVFAPVEVEALRAMPPAERRERFFQYWTLKESYIKARGFGLSAPLDKFWFDFPEEGRIRVSFHRDLADDPRAWLFKLFRPSAAHILAVAVRRKPGEEIRVRLRETIP